MGWSKDGQFQTAESPWATQGPAVRTILLIEDHVDVRALTESVLRTAGYEVISAPDAEEAMTLAVAHASTLDLAITDVRLPGADGIELKKNLTAMLPGLPVLLLSGDAEFGPGSADKTLDFLQKPYDLDELLRVVGKMMRGPAEAPFRRDPPLH